MTTPFRPASSVFRFLTHGRVNRLLGAVVGLLGASGVSLHAQSSVSTGEAIQVGNRYGSYSDVSLGSNGTSDGAPSSVQGSSSYTGMDGDGHTQTMTLGGYAGSSVTYGQLHLSASGSVNNSYYNSGNPFLYDPNTGNPNPGGSPDFLSVFAFGVFTDTLQYGGALQSGYMARYIFHVDGSNSGLGSNANLTVTIAGFQEEFYNFAPGAIDTFYATQAYPINGQSPQTVRVSFAANVGFSLSDFADGSTFTSEANYSNTATLAGIQIVDASGNPVSGITVTSGSGTTYQTVVPEPATWAALCVGCGLVAGTCRRRARRAR